MATQDPKTARLELEGFPEGTAFRPHGMHYQRETGELFVINHAYSQGGERIDVFKVSLLVCYLLPIGQGPPKSLYQVYNNTGPTTIKTADHHPALVQKKEMLPSICQRAPVDDSSHECPVARVAILCFVFGASLHLSLIHI